MLEQFYNFYRTYSIDSTICFMFLLISLQANFPVKKKYAHNSSWFFTLSGALIFTLLFQGVLLTFFDDLIFSTPVHYFYYFLCVFLLGLLLSHYYLQGKLFSKLIFILFFVASIQLYRAFCLPMYSLEGTINQDLYIFMDLGLEILLFLFLYMFSQLFKRHHIQTGLELNLKTKIIMLYLPLSILIAVMIPGYFPNLGHALTYLILLMDMPVIYYLFAELARHYEEQNRLSQALTRAKADQAAFEQISELRTKIRQERHELKNQYFKLQVLMHNQEYEKLEEEIGTVVDRISTNLKSLETGSTYLDYLLLQKQEQAEKYNIPFHVEINLPQDIAYDDTAAGTALSNLIDNAIESSRKEKTPDIQISIRNVKGYFYCEIKNYVTKNVLAANPSLDTTKNDKDMHGFGLKIVRKTLEQANGILNLSVDQSYFKAAFMLPILKASDK